MWPVTSNEHTADPVRLRRFLLQVEDADWRGGSVAALDKLCAALHDLVLQEVLYYEQARTRQRHVSIWTRVLAVIFGTIGLMIPLLAAADPKRFPDIAPYGYPVLAAAAAMLAVNRLFGATGGHIRSTAAQLDLERLLASFRLQWLEWRAKNEEGAHPAAAEAFALMHAFLDAAYQIIQQETLAWGQSVTDALKDYESRLPGKASGPHP